MKKFLVISCWLLVSSALGAHPGIGIVKDSKGNIFYTDLKQVWKITLDGSKSVVVPGVHTHELYVDPQDNLFGEHLWYNGESKDTWGHYAWCLKNTGELVQEIKPTEGFLTNYSFVRDSSGNMYWVERFTTSKIMKKNKTGEITKVLEGKFSFIGWLFAAKNGSLFFTESNQLHRLSPGGKLETLAENSGTRSTDFTLMGRNYNSYGIWTDAEENIYMAMLDSKKVIRVNSNGKSETIINTNSLWTICSGIFDNKGNMWVLENSATNDVRARKIGKEELAGGQTASGSLTTPHLLITIFTGIAIIFLFFAAKGILNKRKQRSVHLAI